MTKSELHTLSIDQAFQHLQSSHAGLSADEAAKRLVRYGRNELPHERPFSYATVFFSQFKNILIIILLGAVAISFVLRDYVDGYVILAAISLNVVIGFIQEIRAERSLEKLRQIVTFKASVRRDGQETRIGAAELVPGDVVMLRTGNRVPADVRLVKVYDLKTNEAALTGESAPVEKIIDSLPSAVVIAERKNCAFFGTTVVRGTAEGMVIATGLDTELGKIAELLKSTKEEPTPLQHKLTIFSRQLGTTILGISSLLFVVGLLLGYDPEQMFVTAVALAVAAVPEGLVVAVTVVLAIGMRSILKQGSLVRKLVAAETLGSTTVICADKTGTLTEGIMRVVKVVTHDRHTDPRTAHQHTDTPHPDASPSYFLALEIGVLASDAYIENPDARFEHRRIIGTPTEQALTYAASQAGVNQRELAKQYRRLEEFPFDSEHKYMATLHEDSQKHRILFIKGAPEILLGKSVYIETSGKEVVLSPERRAKLSDEYRQLSKEGLRLLAVGYKKVGVDFSDLRHHLDLLNKMVIVGFMAMKDPLRLEAKATIEQAMGAGIKTVMITGDHRLTATAIASELGLPAQEGNIIEGARFEKLTHEDLPQRVHDISVYARVNPKDKLRIIDALQERGDVVAMTGDGVNDAPALKSADIGIALGSGTDVAKETADIVLLDNNFKTIVHAVEQGRIIYDNIRKIILYLLSDSFTEILLIGASLLIGLIVPGGFVLPLLASQILWINLITDGFPYVALTMEPAEGDVMKERPVSRKEHIVSRRMWLFVGLISVITAIVNLALFVSMLSHTGDVERVRTLIFTSVAIDSLLYVFSIRSLHIPIWRTNFFSNWYLIAAVGVACILQLAAIYAPILQNVFETVSLRGSDWLIVLVLCVIALIASEGGKYILFRTSRPVS
ncbi:MAG TPA: ATPase [Candidatus Kerfeldbacteria bacterium]|nr:ATPase [Candidatus Kerfeldbacteria bacterium]